MKAILRTAAAAALTLAAAGCGPSYPGAKRFPVYPAGGTLTIDGRPIENIVIALIPVNGDGRERERPQGTTDAAGKFTLTTYDPKDGAPEGEYLARFFPGNNPGEGEEDAGDDQPRKPRPKFPPAVGRRFLDETAMNVKVTIAKGRNEIPPINITSR